MVVTLVPTAWPRISDSVLHLPPVHNRHSPAAPELPSLTSPIAGRAGFQRNHPPESRASAGGSMPAPLPLTRASTSSRPCGVMRQSSCHSTFSIEWIQASVKVEWQEDWRITPQGLELVEARVKGSGSLP